MVLCWARWGATEPAPAAPPSSARQVRADAPGIVIEAHTGARSPDASRLLAPLYEELVGRGFVGGEVLARRYEAAVSRPAISRTGLPVDFADRVDHGHKAWIIGKFDEAVETLGRAIAAARANPGVFAHNQVLHDRLLKGLISLALSQHRKGEAAAARATIGEILRSFPDAALSRAQYGADAYALFEEVRRAAADNGRGRLIVRPSLESAVVFLNERFEKVGTTTKGDLIPGEYRVYVQIGKRPSRAHHVAIRANQETTLAIDGAYDAVVHTSGGWTGLLFADASDRARHEARYAATLARELGAREVVVIGIDQVQGRPALVGALVDRATGRWLRRASLALDPDPSSERVRTLARFLTGEAPAEGLAVQVRQGQPVLGGADGGPRPRRRWMRWSGIAALGLGAVGLGTGLTYALDARARDRDLQEICAVSCTSAQALTLEDARDQATRRAIIFASVGGAVLATGVVLVLLSGSRDPDPVVTIAPLPGGAIASYGFSL